MDPIDREVLTLRHFEHLTNEETALVLGLTKTAASNRYIRALKRLKEILSSIPGLREQLKAGEHRERWQRAIPRPSLRWATDPATVRLMHEHQDPTDEHVQRPQPRRGCWPRSSSTASAAASSPRSSEYAERHPELADEIRDLFPRS